MYSFPPFVRHSKSRSRAQKSMSSTVKVSVVDEVHDNSWESTSEAHSDGALPSKDREPSQPPNPSIFAIFRSFQSSDRKTVGNPLRLSRRDTQLMDSHGYTADDLEQWAYVAAATDSDMATVRLGRVSDVCASASRAFPPVFLLTQLLRAESLSALSLSMLLRHANARLQNARNDLSPTIRGGHTAMILSVRFIRHARNVAPNLLIDIASFACAALRGTTPRGVAVNTHATQRFLVRAYNKLLSLLALPCELHPFLSTSLQSDAQMQIIRHMEAHKPPLQISREGFRGLVAVSLALQKSDEEKEWARVKSNAWPPWRKSQLGIDEDLDFPGRDSRATRMLATMAKHGFAKADWDRAAAILAGWDTDRTPTIQTRTFIERGRPFWQIPLKKSATPRQDEDETLTWSARITATRTLREAWGCFLSYKKSLAFKDVTSRYEAYHAMFKKLCADPTHNLSEDSALPGDGKETFPEPSSARSILYLSTPVMTVSELYNDMLRDGLHPSGRMLALLVENAPDIPSGLKYIKDSQFGEVTKDVLLSAEKYSYKHVAYILDRLPEYFFRAFIKMLYLGSDRCAFSLPGSATGDGSIQTMRNVSPSKYADRLLELSHKRDASLWHPYLTRLLKMTRARPGGQIRHMRPRYVWVESTNCLRRVKEAGAEPNFQMYSLMAQIGVEVLLKVDDKANAIPSTLKQLFEKIAHGDESARGWLDLSKPALLVQTPPPVVLFDLAQVLGIVQDYAGLIKLLEWMRQFDNNLNYLRASTVNGNKFLRRTLIHIRIFMEGSWLSLQEATPGPHDWLASEEEIMQAMEIVGSMSGWDGWPTDKEILQTVSDRSGYFSQVGRVVSSRSGQQTAHRAVKAGEEGHLTG